MPKMRGDLSAESAILRLLPPNRGRRLQHDGPRHHGKPHSEPVCDALRGFRLGRRERHLNSALRVSALRDREKKASCRNGPSRRMGWLQYSPSFNSARRSNSNHFGRETGAVRRGSRPIRAGFVRSRSSDAKQRGWTLDVLNVVRSLGKPKFNLAEIYKSEEKLAHLHPANRHVRDKIRQQLQVLRDLGILEFLRPGEYHIR